MSDAQSVNNSTNKIHKLPFIRRKETIITNYGMVFRNMPGVSGLSNSIREDVIYKAQDRDFFMGKYPDLCIINKVDVVKNNSRTTATYTANGSVVNLTSDAVVKTIGQENYDLVFTALCCVFNQELKIKGLLALLTNTALESKGTQTYDSSFNHLLKFKQRIRHNKRTRVRSYIIEDTPQTVSKNTEDVKIETVPKRVLIDPADFIKLQNIKVEPEENNPQTESLNKSIEESKDNPSANDTIKDNTGANDKNKGDTGTNDMSKDFDSYIKGNSIVSNDKLKKTHTCDVKKTNTCDSDIFPELKLIGDEDNISEVGSVSNLSIGSCFSLSNIESKTKSIFNYIEEHTEFDDQCENELFSIIECVDGSMIKIKGNPDPFHIATPEILKDLSPMDQKKILLHQAYLDWKFCLQHNEDYNLPIHLAVLDNDVALLKRQCLVLKSRHESVDIPAAGNLTALQMAIFQDCPECTVVLLAQGADLLVKDDEARTPLHLAAEIGAQHVEAILEHCSNNAREILKSNDTLWRPDLEDKPDTKLVDYLLTRLNTIYDNQGYTPLMLASKLGNAAAVQLLVGAAPIAVNTAMPSCGNTALYLAAGAACTEAASRGDKTTIPENYKRVVECLVEHGADPSIENNSGSNVTSMLAEMCDVTLSCIIAVKMCKYNGCGDRVGDYMLVKDGDGAVSVASTRPKKNGKRKIVEANDELKVCQPRKVYNAKTSKNMTEARMDVLDTKNGKHDAVVAKIPEISNSSSSINISNNSNGNSSGSGSSSSNGKSTHINSINFNNEIGRPVIVKNLPVITKIVSCEYKQPVLVKNITTKQPNNKGLQTQITAKTSTTVLSSNEAPIVPLGKSVGSNMTQYLKVIAKTGSESPPAKFVSIMSASKRSIQESTAQGSKHLGNSAESNKLKFVKILPKPNVGIRLPAALKLKRPDSKSDSSSQSPIKKPKINKFILK